MGVWFEDEDTPPNLLFTTPKDWLTLGGAVPPKSARPHVKASGYRQYKAWVQSEKSELSGVIS